MKLVSNRKWMITDSAIAENVKERLVRNGGQLAEKVISEHDFLIRHTQVTLVHL